MNAAHPHGQGLIAPEYFVPYSKNPTISKFFMQMGRGKELGSGAKPQSIEGNPSITVIPLPAEAGGTGL
jgi:hypothetical protein